MMFFPMREIQRSGHFGRDAAAPSLDRGILVTVGFSDGGVLTTSM
jgi:hypothetical protein